MRLNCELEKAPFKHFHAIDVLDEPAALWSWLHDAGRPWKLVETDFYEQFELSLWDVKLPSNLAYLLEATFLEAFTDGMERIFAAKLRPEPEICAHKLVAGQTIRLHNDFLPRGESHRFLLHLNTNPLEYGGLFILFAGDCPSKIVKIIKPTRNHALGFEISGESYHAVSTQHYGERYTVVFSFSRR